MIDIKKHGQFDPTGRSDFPGFSSMAFESFPVQSADVNLDEFIDDDQKCDSICSHVTIQSDEDDYY